MDDLRRWLNSINPATYVRDMPWSPEIVAAYNEYKRLAEIHGSAHTAFERYFQETRSRPTPEQHLKRARMAIEWGEAALRYFHRFRCLPYHTSLTGLLLFSVAEARLAFVVSYQNAYSTTDSIKTHIGAGEGAILSGRKAVHDARFNYDGMNILVSKANYYD